MIFLDKSSLSPLVSNKLYLCLARPGPKAHRATGILAKHSATTSVKRMGYMQNNPTPLRPYLMAGRAIRSASFMPLTSDARAAQVAARAGFTLRWRDRQSYRIGPGGWFARCRRREDSSWLEMGGPPEHGPPSPKTMMTSSVLELSWKMIEGTLAQWTVEDLSRTYRQEYKGLTFAVSYQWTNLANNDARYPSWRRAGADVGLTRD